MSSPFGGHPTLGRYIAWIRNLGFEAKSGTGPDESGKTHTVTKIFKEGGSSVVVVGVDQTEHMVATMVGYLDRRLGVKSPFFSIDNGDLE
jgi:hypothetical protein